MDCMLKKHLLFLAMLFWSSNFTSANITALCGTADRYWEFLWLYPTGPFTLACTGLSAQDTVTWNLLLDTGESLYLSSCPPLLPNRSEPVCENKLNHTYKARRIAYDTSIIVFKLTQLILATWILNASLFCATRESSVAASGCRMDMTHPADYVSCTTQFRNDSWIVFGQCDIIQVLSKQKRYWCDWIQTKESAREEIFIARTAFSNTNFWYPENVTCNFTSYLPTDGHYTYRVNIAPGEVRVNASFIGSDEMRRPSQKVSHNCPQHVAAGSYLSCVCYVRDLGSPPGVLQWTSTFSTLLAIANVQPSDSKTYTCQLLWNNSVVQFETYTLSVARLQHYEDYEPYVSEESTTLTVQDKTVQSTDNSFTIKVAVGGSLGGGVIIIGLTICQILIKRRNNRNSSGPCNTELQFTCNVANCCNR